MFKVVVGRLIQLLDILSNGFKIAKILGALTTNAAILTSCIAGSIVWVVNDRVVYRCCCCLGSGRVGRVTGGSFR